MSKKLKVGYVPVGESPCPLCCLKDYCPMEGFCKCDEYWANHRDDKHNEDSEVYFIKEQGD